MRYAVSHFKKIHGDKTGLGCMPKRPLSFGSSHIANGDRRIVKWFLKNTANKELEGGLRNVLSPQLSEG